MVLVQKPRSNRDQTEMQTEMCRGISVGVIVIPCVSMIVQVVCLRCGRFKHRDQTEMQTDLFGGPQQCGGVLRVCTAFRSNVAIAELLSCAVCLVRRAIMVRLVEGGTGVWSVCPF